MSEKQRKPLLSIVVPAFREESGIENFYQSLKRELNNITHVDHEIIFVNDGSPDHTGEILLEIGKGDSSVRILGLSRNFGKEAATTAGINNAHGDAIIALDADGQHPVELIKEFVFTWQQGHQVVIGVRTHNNNEGFIKRYGSKAFYAIFNKTTGMKLIPGSTDFRLIDKTVQKEFIKLTERNRITRGLIDWLGYRRKYIEFEANARESGEASYSVRKLFILAINSIVSLSTSPLYFASFLGAIIIPASILLAIFMFIEVLVGDPLGLNITGTAFVAVLIALLVGVLLFSQGILGLYLSHIHAETQNRPLYIIDHHTSLRVSGDDAHTI